MTVHLHWFLPTGGDGRTLVDRHAYAPNNVDAALRVRGVHAPDIDYLAQIAKAAEQLGFEAVLTPTGTWCEDAWLTTVALAQQTERLKFLVAFRPGVISPTLAAQMAATYQRVTRGRLLLNVVTGGDSSEQRRFGDHLDHDERYGRTDEFLSVVRGVWRGQPFDFDGAHYRVEGGRTALPPDPVPQIFFGGSSAAAGPVAARHADVYLTWGEPPAQVKEKIDWIRALAEKQRRTVRFGIRLHTISRNSSADAWTTANRLLDDLDADTITAAQTALGRSESVGQQRMLALHGGSRDALEISPNLWAGVGLVRGGAGTALVGSHAEVADRIEEYHSLGIEHFVLSGYPHLEEAYWFGEGVIPDLAARGLLSGPSTTVGGGAPLLVASGRWAVTTSAWSRGRRGTQSGKIRAPGAVRRSVNNTGVRDVTVVVIGAGQAGLAGAYHLRRTGFEPERDFVVLDHAPRPGGAWQFRWPSLTYGKVHGIHALPGLELTGADPARPSSEVIPEYFDTYEQTFDLRVRRPVDVRAVREGEADRLLVETSAGTWSTRALINATGTWDRPFWPRYPGQETFRGRQLHTAQYPGPEAFAGQRVVVVGGGVSGTQHLLEIAPHATATTWVTRRPPVFREGPFDQEAGRGAVALVEERVRQGLPPRSVVSVTGLPLNDAIRQGIADGVLDRLPMFDRITPDGVEWAGGRRVDADVILWATGFRAALDHLAPLRLREPGGGIRVDGTRVVADPRIHLVGYGPSASTIGANRAGRTAVRDIRRQLAEEPLAA